MGHAGQAANELQMPVTAGSIGDIIAICLLVRDCVDALSESRGAVASYQAVIRELYVLEKALLEISLLAQNQSNVPELNELRESAKTTVDGCQKSLEVFKKKIGKYEKHFGNDGNKIGAKKMLTVSAFSLLWQVQMKNDVAQFRAEVVAYSVSVNQLLSASQM